MFSVELSDDPRPWNRRTKNMRLSFHSSLNTQNSSLGEPKAGLLENTRAVQHVARPAGVAQHRRDELLGLRHQRQPFLRRNDDLAVEFVHRVRSLPLRNLPDPGPANSLRKTARNNSHSFQIIPCDSVAIFETGSSNLLRHVLWVLSCRFLAGGFA